MTFDDLNLNKPLLNALSDLNLVHPTKIQAETFSVVMSGKDLIGIAQTGTGKTLAYLLPVMRLWKYSKSKTPGILIIVPTRELVVQVVETIDQLSAYMNLEAVGVYGGTNIRTQKAKVAKGYDIVVGTPGRLLDMILDGIIKPKPIKKLIIDEVDEMLNLGFRTQLMNLLDLLPASRQNLLFSATLTEEVAEFIGLQFGHMERIEAAPMGTPLENIEQHYFSVPNFNTKINLLKSIISEKEVFNKVLVFTASKKMADLVFERMETGHESELGIIHSNKAQNFRFNTVNAFHSGEIRILIATDIVARGIDVSEVSHVINFDMPEVPENYIHRIGRTGRADKQGTAISFITEKEEEAKHGVEALMQMNIPKLEMPEAVEISTELIPDEIPKVKMPNMELKAPRKSTSGPAFHEKKAKNKKTNQKVRYKDKMKAKYKKPKTRGQKRKKKR